MGSSSYKVAATWDGEASVWVATSDDVPGLVAEAPTPEDLIAKLRVLIPELLELNKHLVGDGTGPVSVKTQFNRFDRELEIA